MFKKKLESQKGMSGKSSTFLRTLIATSLGLIIITGATDIHIKSKSQVNKVRGHIDEVFDIDTAKRTPVIDLNTREIE